METNLEKKNAGEYMESNHIIFWSGSHPENKIGIYIMGGCDLPSVFSCVPLIKPILKGTCCILKEGQIEKSRSDILLQNLKDCPQDLLAPVLEKFYLPGNFFDNQLFSPSFGVSNGSNFEEFPKQVVILSIAPDVARVVYQHREHGFLIDPSGWWNNQRMDLMLRDLSSANWFRKHFVSLGRMTLETFIENFTQLINQIKQATNVHILVFNTLTIEPGNITHNYQFVKRPESLRRREFNLALVELSRKLNFWIVDIDKVLKQTRTKNMVDFAHFPVQLYQPIGQEVFRILEELEIFQVPTQSSKDSSRQWIKVQRNVIAAKVMYFIHVGNWERAKLEFERATAILEREHWQELAIVEAHLSPEKHDQILKDWGVGSIEWYLNMYKKLSPQEQQTQTLLKSLQTPLDQNTQELKVQQLENQAKAEIDRYQESLQQVQEQTKIQIEHLQTQLQQTQVQLQQTQEELVKSQSDLQYSEDQLKQIHSQVQQTKTELTQSQLELHICQTELGQFKSYLRQTQGVEGIRSYYRSRIASNPDDIQLYHQALEIKPDDAQVHLQLGRVLIRQNRPKDAITSYQTALQFQPDNFEIYLELGKALEKEKKWEDAITSYRRAIKLNPDYSWSHKHLGDALAQLGKIHEASTCYHRALQIQPRIF